MNKLKRLKRELLKKRISNKISFAVRQSFNGRFGRYTMATANNNINDEKPITIESIMSAMRIWSEYEKRRKKKA